MKIAICLLFTLMLSCMVYFVSYYIAEKQSSAPVYIKKPTINTHSINQEEAMDILKAGYYMGGIRQRQKEDLDLYWRSDSLYFVKKFIHPTK